MSTSTRGLRSMVRSRGGWLLLTGLVVPRAASTVSVFATSAVLGPDGRGVIAFVLGTATLVMTAGGFALFIPAVRERQEGSALVARQYLDLTVFLVVGLDALLFLWAVLAPTGLLAPDTAVFIAIIALATAGVLAVGLVIALMPSILARHHLANWSGMSTFCVISCGLLFQPLARRMTPVRSTGLGLLVLPCSYALLAWGAHSGTLPAVLLGAIGASSACYGFIYLGGLSAVNALAGTEKTRASAGFFLLAYMGFSLPVIFTGLLADRFGAGTALGLFGALLLAGCLLVAGALLRAARNTAIQALLNVR